MKHALSFLLLSILDNRERGRESAKIISLEGRDLKCLSDNFLILNKVRVCLVGGPSCLVRNFLHHCQNHDTISMGREGV